MTATFRSLAAQVGDPLYEYVAKGSPFMAYANLVRLYAKVRMQNFIQRKFGKPKRLQNFIQRSSTYAN